MAIRKSPGHGHCAYEARWSRSTTSEVTMKHIGWAPAMVLAGVVAACDQGPVGPGDSFPQFDHAVGTVPQAAQAERLWVCKDGPAGTYDFTVSYNSMVGNHFVEGAFTVDAGECVHVASSGLPLEATVTEGADPPGVDFDQITVDAAGPINQSINGKVATVEFGIDNDGPSGVPPSGAVITYFNVDEPPPPPGGEGCTPGYWKQPQHFDSWEGFLPGDDFDTTFGVDLFNPDLTLLQAAAQGGGGVNAMARHAVAALLNAASSGVNYDMTVAEVIAAVQAAEASGDFEGAKNVFAGFNEQGCGLN
ncbi:MAG: hypothetical protein ACREL7_02060 [Longimicrobiales bacterium]